MDCQFYKNNTTTFSFFTESCVYNFGVIGALAAIIFILIVVIAVLLRKLRKLTPKYIKNNQCDKSSNDLFYDCVIPASHNQVELKLREKPKSKVNAIILPGRNNLQGRHSHQTNTRQRPIKHGGVQPNGELYMELQVAGGPQQSNTYASLAKKDKKSRSSPPSSYYNVAIENAACEVVYEEPLKRGETAI